ncbi:unnamed protein product [Ectocarpus sp. 12 AP-2014]
MCNYYKVGKYCKYARAACPFVVNKRLGCRCAAGVIFRSQKEYLKEPTAEFKAMEARQADFSAAQRAYKQEFVKKLDAFLAIETDEEAVSTLNAMSNTVIQHGGLPESVRINDLLKTCRRKKAAMKDSGKWSTPVQIAYETLVQTTNRTVVPLQSGS